MAMYTFVFFILYKSGEILSINEIIDQQNASIRPVIYGSAYSERTIQYKYHYVLKRAPSVLAIGKSRVMQFRAAFFKDPSSFFNVGGAIIGIEDFQTFLEGIPQAKSPRMIILCLDQHFFNPNWDRSAFPKFKLAGNSGSFDILANQGWHVYQEYLKHKFALAPLFKKNSTGTDLIGIYAITFQNGYRKDGSYSYGKIISQNSRDLSFKESFDAIEEGKDTFAYGDHLDPKALQTLEHLLQFCKQRYIHVIAFLPPYAHVVFEKLMSLPEKYGYLPEIAPTLEPLCKKYGASFFNFSDLSSVGAPDFETTDGFHGSEKAYLRLFLIMQSRDQQLHSVAAKETYLQQRLADAVSPYVVFRQDE